MASATLISVDEYLATTYRPDSDLIDGQLLERNLGEDVISRDLPIEQIITHPQPADGVLRADSSPIAIPLADLFAELD